MRIKLRIKNSTIFGAVKANAAVRPRRFLVSWCSWALLPWGAKGVWERHETCMALHLYVLIRIYSQVLFIIYSSFSTWWREVFSTGAHWCGCGLMRIDADWLFTFQTLADYHLHHPGHNASRSLGSCKPRCGKSTENREFVEVPEAQPTRGSWRRLPASALFWVRGTRGNSGELGSLGYVCVRVIVCECVLNIMFLSLI